jgi:hypothetical protein
VELYTSLTRLKMAMNGGALPPMTPPTQDALALFDPAFFPGMGALNEDAERGVQCPVRGCGRWFQNLGAHWARGHPSIGGVAVLRRVLSLPHRAPLASAKFRLAHAEQMKARIAAGYVAPLCLKHERGQPGRRKTVSTYSVGTRNLRDRCVAQLTHRIQDVAHTIGRSPSQDEFKIVVGTGAGGLVQEITRVFGSWNAAKAHCGLLVCSAGRTRDKAPRTREYVLDVLASWHEQHGELPTTSQAYGAGGVAPVLPAYKTILRALHAPTWMDAMERAASLLNIYGGRYGLPEKQPKVAV